METFVVLYLIIMLLLIAHKFDIFHKSNQTLSSKSKIFLFLFIFCALGIVVTISIIETSIFYSLLLFLFYFLFVKSLHLQQIAKDDGINIEKNMEIKKLKLEIEELTRKLNNQNQIPSNLLSEIECLKTEKSNLLNDLNNLNKDLIIQYSNVDDYSNISSPEIKNNLNLLKLEQNNLIKNNSAINYFSTSTDLNKKILNNNIAQLLRNFNLECDCIYNKLSIKNIDSSRSKIEKSFISLNKLYELDNVQISQVYYELKLKELILNYSYLKQLEEEKEEKRIHREQLIEEEKVRKEIENEKLKLEKEEKHFNNEISKLMSYLSKNNDETQKSFYMERIKELENKLQELNENKEKILQREKNTRAGFVYIISNIGSFGDNIYKIGMTRRLDPLERIKELSDASVPFSFDVHALIFCDDAPALENILHKTFEKNRVNKENPRKEFYNIDLNNIKEVVRNNYNKTVEFTDYADAVEYRKSIKA